MTSPSPNLSSNAWQNPETYSWTKLLPRRACGWEFFRRRPDYRAAWATIAGSRKVEIASSSLFSITVNAADIDPSPWGLLHPLEDPNSDARYANVFWSPSVCPAILPVIGVEEKQGHPSNAPQIASYDCRTTIFVDAEGTQHVLFSKEGRALQLAVRGAPFAITDRLLADIPRPGQIAVARLRAIKQLADLEMHRDLRPSLYPPHGQGRRLVEVLQALDGALLGASHREIAIALYGAARVASDWAGQNRQMRDKVRKTIARGMELMMDGYKQFLR